MEHKITFRSIKASDYPALERILCDTWKYEQFCSSACARTMAKLYLASCLVEQTFTQVALRNNEPVGVIMGKNEQEHRPSLRYIIRLVSTGILMFTKKEGRKIAKLFGGFEQIDKNLLAECKTNFDGQLAFFVVRDDQRGSGIGKQLYQSFLAYLEKEDLHSFYLYTDTKCNYKFYEHQGLIRLKETTTRLNLNTKEEIHFFLYANTL